MDPSLLGRPVPVPTKQKPTGPFTKKTLLLTIGGAVAVIAGVLMLSANQDSSATLQPQLSARQITTLKIVADGQKNIADPDLKKLNSELNITLSSDNAAVQAALKSAGMEKIDKAVTAAEADAKTFSELTTAKLNGRYDQEYKTVLERKLESLRALLQELHGATKNKTLKSTLADEYKHLGIHLESLQALSL